MTQVPEMTPAQYDALVCAVSAARNYQLRTKADVRAYLLDQEFMLADIDAALAYWAQQLRN